MEGMGTCIVPPSSYQCFVFHILAKRILPSTQLFMELIPESTPGFFKEEKHPIFTIISYPNP
jgi:hypothetical protein